MAKKGNSFDDLLEEALKNARADREKTLEAYDKMKDALSVETDDEIHKAMLVGEKPVKLLEQLTRSNQQIVQLAQLKEKQQSKAGKEKRKPLDISELYEEIEEGEKDQSH